MVHNLSPCRSPVSANDGVHYKFTSRNRTVIIAVWPVSETWQEVFNEICQKSSRAPGGACLDPFRVDGQNKNGGAARAEDDDDDDGKVLLNFGNFNSLPSCFCPRKLVKLNNGSNGSAL